MKRFYHAMGAGAALSVAAALGCSPTPRDFGTGGAGGNSSSAQSSSTSGGGVKCLDASASTALFTILDPAFCAVAVYTTDDMLPNQPATWGAHGGPLTVRAGQAAGSVDLVRWAAPSDTTGKLTSTPTTVAAMIPTMGAFLGAQAIDLPFFGWTAFSWSGAFPMTQGEVVLAKGSSVSKRYPANGVYALLGVASDTAYGRLLMTGLSAINDAATNTNGLYAADSCGTSDAPTLLPGMDPNCTPPIAVATWGEASGPLAADKAGHVFVVMASFATGAQDARGFAAGAIGRGQGPTGGNKLFTLSGFGSSLAALAPAAGENGVLLFQPFDATTFDPLDVIAQRYSVSGGSIQAVGAPAAMLKLTAKASLTLMRDDQERVWVQGSTMSGTTFVVIQRAP